MKRKNTDSLRDRPITSKKTNKNSRKTADPIEDEIKYTGNLQLIEPDNNPEQALKELAYQSELDDAKIQALLSSSTYTSAQRKAIENIFGKLSEAIKSSRHISIPENEIPLTHPQKSMIVKECEFLSPVDVKIIGSYVHNIALCNDATVDVRVVIPKEYFRKGDHMDQIYTIRKAFYLACLQGNLQSCKLFNCEIEYICPQENPLDIALSVMIEESITFIVYAHTEENAFSLSLKSISLNHAEQNVTTSGGNRVFEHVKATPLYNMTALSNMLYKHSEELLSNIVNSSSSVKEIMCLLKIWLHQRQLDQGFGCFSGFISQMFVVYLVRKQIIKSRQQNSLELFLQVLNQLANFDWSSGISLQREDPKNLIEKHKKNSAIVFLCPKGRLNYCAAVQKTTVRQVQDFARDSYSMITQEKTMNALSNLFITRAPYYLQNDFIIRVCLPERISPTKKSAQLHMDSCGDVVCSRLPSIVQCLEKGLSERITSLSFAPILRTKVAANNVSQFGCLETGLLTIGMHINPKHAYNTVVRGPSADDDEQAAEFRRFWGERSTLRRFVDGGINEAVAWEAESFNERRTIIGRIVSHLLSRHVGIQAADITYAVNQLDDVLMYTDLTCKTSANKHNVGTGEEEHQPVLAALDTLSKHLRSINTLPLAVTEIRTDGAIGRFTEVFPPKVVRASNGKQSPNVYAPIRVICVLEGSGQFPQAKEPLAKMKTMLLLKIQEFLGQIDSVVAVMHSTDRITVAQDGFIFDIELMHMFEQVQAKVANMQLKLLPLLTSTLHGVHTQFSSYAAGARLFKRWIGVHLLSSFFPDTVSDTFASYVFCNAKPYKVPRCPMIAFLRMLELLVYHDWAAEPLFINSEDCAHVISRSELLAEFTEQRWRYPALTMFTSFDKRSFVSRCVEPFMLHKVRQTAMQCFSAVEELIKKGNWQKGPLEAALFTSSLDTMDILITLKRHATRQQVYDLKLNFSEERAGEINAEQRRMPEALKKLGLCFDPAQSYISYIRSMYSDVVMVMYDETALNHIGLLWKPGVHSGSPVKDISEAELKLHSRSLVDVDGTLYAKLDVNRMVYDLEIFGKGLVKSIDVCSAE